ncbi:MAG: hypothetical protein FWF44_02290 [Defluviitaleaceae bacterium]|nr:hypothetical protein [Defluviitaleaceae bacterium]
MPNLSHSELNNIREVASCHQNVANKLNTYSGQCNDQQLKAMFSKAAQDAQKAAQQLIQMI